MSVIALILGIISFFWLGIALIPFLGWLNWFNVPFAVVGLIFGLVAYSKNRGSVALTAIILNASAMVIGILRLSLGGGFI